MKTRDERIAELALLRADMRVLSGMVGMLKSIRDRLLSRGRWQTDAGASAAHHAGWDAHLWVNSVQESVDQLNEYIQEEVGAL